MPQRTNEVQPPWRYEPESPKRKHHWDFDEPGFVEVPKRGAPGCVRVGKCPASLTVSDCESLMRDAIPWSPAGWDRSYPQRLYVIHERWLYRAMPTQPGISYHGFPEDPDGGSVPESLYERIRELARAKSCEREIERWLRQFE
jgi:hypothetical protein